MLFLIPVSYFFSRICCEVGNLTTRIVQFILRKNKIELICSEYRRISDYINADIYTPQEKEIRTRSNREAFDEQSESKHLMVHLRELTLRLVIGYSLCGFFVLVYLESFFAHPSVAKRYIFVFLIFSLLYSCITDFELIKYTRKLISITERKALQPGVK